MRRRKKMKKDVEEFMSIFCVELEPITKEVENYLIENGTKKDVLEFYKSNGFKWNPVRKTIMDEGFIK